MGRKKIKIIPIEEEKTRNITFNKRKTGLLKKAAELSMLCNIKVYLVFTDIQGNIIHFSSPNSEIFEELMSNCQNNQVSAFDQSDYPDFFKQKKTQDNEKNQKKQAQGQNNSSQQTEEVNDDNDEEEEEEEENFEENSKEDYANDNVDEEDNQNQKNLKQNISNSNKKQQKYSNKLNKYQNNNNNKLIKMQHQNPISKGKNYQILNDNLQNIQQKQQNFINQKRFIKPKNLKIEIPKTNQFLKAQMHFIQDFNLKKQGFQKQMEGKLNHQQQIGQYLHSSNIQNLQPQLEQYLLSNNNSNNQQQQQQQLIKQEQMLFGEGLISGNQHNRNQLLHNFNEDSINNLHQYLNANLLSQTNQQNMEKLLPSPQTNIQKPQQNKYNLRNSAYNKDFEMRSPDPNELLNHYYQNSNQLKSGNLNNNFKETFRVDKALDVRNNFFNSNNIGLISPQELIDSQLYNTNYNALSENSGNQSNNDYLNLSNEKFLNNLQNQNDSIQNALMLQSKKIKKIKSKQQ